jgi:hypothetical protein
MPAVIPPSAATFPSPRSLMPPTLSAQRPSRWACATRTGDPRTLEALRAALPLRVELWVGGPGAGALALPPQVSYVSDTHELERKVALLLERGAPS